MDENIDVFIDEIKENLENINNILINLDNEEISMNDIDELFRYFHTMKSSTAMMEYFKLSDIIHKMEDVLFEIKEGNLEINQRLIDLIFIFHDFIDSSIDILIKNNDESYIDGDYIINTINKILSGVKKEEVVKIYGKENISYSDERLSFLNKELVSKDLFLVRIFLEGDIVFQSINTWVIFNEIKDCYDIVFSIPNLLTEDEFKKKDYKINNDKILCLISSRENIQEVKKSLEAKLTNVSKLEVEKYFEIGDVIEKEILEEVITRINNENNNDREISINQKKIETRDEICIQKEMLEEFNIYYIEQIIEKLKLTASGIVAFESNIYNLDYVRYIFRNVNFVKGLAGFIDLNNIFELANNVEKFLHNIIIKKQSVNGEVVDLLADAVEILVMMSKNYIMDEVCIPLSVLDDINYSLINGLEINAEDIEEDEKIQTGKIGEILKQQGKLTDNDVEEILEKQKNSKEKLLFGQMAVKEDKAELKDVIKSLRIQENTKKAEKISSSFIKVHSKKVDKLVNLLGELIILHSLHKEELNSNIVNKRVINNNFLRIERITKEIQDISMSMRMLTLDSTFKKLKRVAKDAASGLDKEIKVILDGENTHIDRMVAEKLFEPLMHLVRNAVSHGIENKNERIKIGKEEIGKVFIKAYNKKGYIYIEIADDGRGMSLEKIYNKAVEKGLIEKNAEYSEYMIKRLIFQPGFSTQEVINNISGRGVGMNVVESEVLKLRGKIEIETVENKGSKFITRLPINLSTLNGTIIEICGDKYVVPTLNIREFFKPRENQWFEISETQKMIKLREELINVIDIEEYLEMDVCVDKKKCIIVIIELDQMLLALPVDNVIGKQEVVVKYLGDELNDLDYAVGATILGDGKVSIILEIENMFKINDYKSFDGRIRV